MAKFDLKQSIERTKSLVIDLAELRKVEPAQVVNWANQTFQEGGFSLPGKILTVVLCTYSLAGITAFVAEKYIPAPPMSRPMRPVFSNRRIKTLDEYSVIFARNLFNSKGVIADDDAAPGSPIQDLGGAPIRTMLPLNLTGTMILRDELRSIATIEDKSNSTIYPMRVEDEIPSKLKIVKIEVRKVTFINSATGRREFIDMPDDSTGSGLSIGNSFSRPTGPGIEQSSATQFNIARTEVDKAFGDMNSLLTQARAVPNFENGLPAGYKLFQIVPGSVYDKLGLKNGDVIAGVNGESINDPGVAFQKLSELKTSSRVELQIKRDGRPSTYTYDIR
ncbi:MAG: type II secretion system protein GspC [Bdellovibrionota bacterium]